MVQRNMSCVYRKLDSAENGPESVGVVGSAGAAVRPCVEQMRFSESVTSARIRPFSAESSFRYTQDIGAAVQYVRLVPIADI